MVNSFIELELASNGMCDVCQNDALVVVQRRRDYTLPDTLNRLTKDLIQELLKFKNTKQCSNRLNTFL